MTDFSSWYSQKKACEILGCSPRTLNEKIQRRGWAIERRSRPIAGRKPEPCYSPADVDRIKAEQEPGAAVFAPDSGIGPLSPALQAGRSDLLTLLDRVAQRALPLLEPVGRDRGPWLKAPAAAERSGLTVTVMRRIMRRLVDARSPDAIEDGGLKIRAGALEELDGSRLRELGGNRAAKKAASDSAEQAANSAERPVLVSAEVEAVAAIRIEAPETAQVGIR